MELYTSLVRLKQEMNGGQLPPMTPVPERLWNIIDPEFTIGLGALAEDAEKGLRCPVRGCGVWRHGLTKHLDMVHQAIGGASGVRKALSIPETAALSSSRTRLRISLATRLRMATGQLDFAEVRKKLSYGKDRLRRQGKTCSRSRATVGSRNLRDSCVTQLSHKLIDLHNKLGRSPTSREFRDAYGIMVEARVKLAFGTWDNAKALCGLEVYAQGRGPNSNFVGIERVLTSFAAWYAAHGSLPSQKGYRSLHRAPMMPSENAIYTATGIRSWNESMRRIASRLNIYGGRYGLPIEHKPKEDAA